MKDYEDQVREDSLGWNDASKFHKRKKGKKKKKKKMKRRVRELEQELFLSMVRQAQAPVPKKSKKGKKAKAKKRKKKAKQLLWQEVVSKGLDFATAYYMSKSSSKTFSKAPNWDTVYVSAPPPNKQTPLALPEGRG